jgi:hypothetical protein
VPGWLSYFNPARVSQRDRQWRGLQQQLSGHVSAGEWPVDGSLRSRAGRLGRAAVTNLDAAIEYLDLAMEQLLSAQEEIDQDDPDLRFTRRQIDTARAMIDSDRLMLERTQKKRDAAVQL